MSRQRTKYEVVSDRPLVNPRRVYGSNRPFTHAVLTEHTYDCDENGAVCTSGSPAGKVRLWSVSRCSFSLDAARAYAQKLFARGYPTVIAPMRPAADQRQRRRAK